MADEPALLLGVGATKAGTSWLYSYLAGHADCRFRAVKELHFFDALDDGSRERQIAQLEAARDAAVSKQAKAKGAARAALEARIADFNEMISVHRAGSEAEALKRYMAYVMRDRGAAKVVGDITPAYALLSGERLSMMARLTPATRLLYLMRDPVDRLWSHVRMHATRSAAPGEDLAGRAVAVLRRVLRKDALPAVTRRGDYAAALTKLLAAVPGPRLFVDYYERLISDEGIARLCGFLGIGHAPAPVAKRVHAGPAIPLDPELRLEAARMLAPQYDFVERTLGPLPARWQANRMGE
ncbi:sulfotransferase [Solirhodobacter olei]|uniref:sulfotransferase n=1 Tax=Solirhodobacter olei TaxID=2493082 RepID=UPI000FDB4B2B|nr:sulfotransferase [Solirhodobacter olei]